MKSFLFIVATLLALGSVLAEGTAEIGVALNKIAHRAYMGVTEISVLSMN